MINSCEEKGYISDFDKGKWEDLAWMLPNEEEDWI